MTPAERAAVERLRLRLGWGPDVASDQELLDSYAGQREVLAVQTELLRLELKANLARLAQRLLNLVGWPR